MKKIVLVAVMCAFMSVPALADLTPVGLPVFGGSISQGASMPWHLPWVGMRVVAPAGFNGAYIEGISGVGALVTSAAKYESRDDFAGGSASQLVEGWWDLDGSHSWTATFEIAEPLGGFPSGTAADYVGLTVQCALAQSDQSFYASREWIFTNGAAPGGTPTGGGSWINWNNGWYLSPLHYDGSAWSGNPVPVPGAILLGILGLSAVGLKLRKHV